MTGRWQEDAEQHRKRQDAAEEPDHGKTDDHWQMPKTGVIGAGAKTTQSNSVQNIPQIVLRVLIEIRVAQVIANDVVHIRFDKNVELPSDGDHILQHHSLTDLDDEWNSLCIAEGTGSRLW